MGETRFASEFFAGNRKNLRELFTGTAPIVLAANGVLQKSADEAFPFKQDVNFWYLTGIEEPDIILVLDKDKEYLIIPEHQAKRVWHEKADTEAALRRISGVDTILGESDGWKRLNGRFEKAKHVATLPAEPIYDAKAGQYANPARRRVLKRLRQINPDLRLLDITEHFAHLRAVKQPPELEAIQAGIELTSRALKQLGRKIGAGKYAHEFDAEADATKMFRIHGAFGHAFGPIIAGGDRACQPYYNANNAALASGELVVCDIGAQVDHYASDLTRTFSVGEPSKRQRAVYQAVLDVQLYALSQLKPGVILRDTFETDVHAFMGEQLRQLGLIKSIDHEAVKEFYPHSTSHFMGLDTHDVGFYDQPLQPGMVVTVEPGIYIRKEGIGVRIEDNVLITADGVQNLSRRLPKALKS